MISRERTSARRATVPAGKPQQDASSPVVALVELALELGDDVHHLAVASMKKMVGNTKVHIGEPPDVVDRDR